MVEIYQLSSSKAVRSLVIYSLYFSQFVKSRMQYKWDFFASIFSSAMVSLSGMLFVVFLIDGKTVPELKGWTRDEVLFIYGYSMLAMFSFTLVSRNIYQFGDRYIIQGQFDRVLLRPLNSLCQVLFESFNLEAFGHLIVGIGVLLYTKGRLEIEFGAVDYLWLFISGISGGLILVSVFVFLAALSFHFEDRLGIAPPFYNLINFGRYPMPIFNNFIQFILRWVVPFGFVAFYPATHFFDRDGFEFLCYLTPVVAFVCVLVTLLFWQFGVSRYASTGN